MPYARLLEVIEAVSKAKQREQKEEWRRAAWIGYQANPPARGTGKSRTVIPFRDWLAMNGLAEPKPVEVPEISDEDVKKLLAAGRQQLRLTRKQEK